MRIAVWAVLCALASGCASVVVATGQDARADAAPDVAAPPAADAAPDDGLDGEAVDAAACPARQAACGRDCVYLGIDARHCGACGRACPSGALCRDGACVCSGTVCGDACVSLSSDAAHCGACGRACAEGLVCREGRCGCPVATCDGACVDTRTDAAHCGACGRACAPSERCAAGACACDVVGRGSCGGAACGVDLRADARHCGACGAACLAGQRCEAARCALVCPRGAADCDRDADGVCEVFTATSDAHCGACGNICTGGTRCLAGRCVATEAAMLAPGSALAVTSARPWFRWRLPPAAEGVRLQVCSDRECAQVELRADVDGDSFRPGAPLRVGAHFWRVFVRRGTAVAVTPGPTWEFFVPGVGATWDTSSGGLYDLNGDGFEDRVTLDPGADVAAVRVAYTRSPRIPPGTDTVFRGPRALDVPSGGTTLLGPPRVFAGGDFDGDGYADLVLWYTRVTTLGSEFYPSDVTQLVFGSAEGLSDRAVTRESPRAGLPMPVPALEALRAVGGLGGGSEGAALRLTRWNGGVPHECSTGLAAIAPVAGLAPSTGEVACESATLASGDFNGDGRVDVVLGRVPAFLARTDGPPLALRACASSPTDLSGERWRRVAVDVDQDGYDDLVFEPTGGGARHAVYGGPAGLDGTRCATVP